MSYTVLARRYRSGTFDEVVGQEHVAQTLKKAIASGRVAHAYLFCGTRGVGKTSMARILAKALNCENAKGPTGEPCLKCESCKAIARGDDIDVIEIDAASNTGVDNVRDLIANSQFMPARSRFKVYIIDEVHMLSKSAFNALLKTLEEPPSHVKFILATTEPEKVLPTILSRCQRYDFRNIPSKEIAGHLRRICKEEKIKAQEDALLLIAKAGAGSMRDSLSLLDRLLSVGEKELTVELIESMLGLPKIQLIFELAQAMGEGDVKKVLTGADKMIQGGLSVDTFIASLIEHLRNLLILRTCGVDSDLVEVPGLSAKELGAQAERFDAVALTQDIAILEELRRQIRTSQAGRAMVDAALVRMTLAEQFSSIAQLLDGPNGAARQVAGTVKKKFDEPVAAATRPSPQPFHLPLRGNPGVPGEGEMRGSAGASPSQDVESGSNVEPVGLGDLPRVWQGLLALLAERGAALHSLVSQGKLVRIEDGRAVIQYQKQHETFVKMLDRNGKKEIVRDALTKVAGENLGVQFEVEESGDAAVATAKPQAAVAAAPVRREIPKTETAAPSANLIKITPELVESLRESEPLIRDLMDRFGAQVVKVEE